MQKALPVVDDRGVISNDHKILEKLKRYYIGRYGMCT